MKKYVAVLSVLLFAFCAFAQGQNVLDGVYVKEHVPTRKVVPFCPLRQADVMWSKRIWRTIDINEKLNLPLKYPATKTIRDRKNLIDLIHDAVLEGSLTAYNGIDDEFTTPYTKSEVEELGAVHDTVNIADPTTGIETQKIINDPLKRDNIIKYRLKEDWFFDKQRSVMDVRIIGIAPVIMKTNKETGEPIGDQVLYWVYFPEARKIFANSEVFNRFNDAERWSYDDVFMKRMFTSFIIKESNVYDRRIADYKINPLDALLEAQKIKDDIFNQEHDLWEY